MTKEQLIQKLGDLEWEDFEVKAAKSEVPKSAWETVSAFANTNGGWLVFGVRQIGKQFEIQGVNNAEKIEQDFLSTLNSEKFNKRLGVKSHLYDIGKVKVLAFYIEASSLKPIYYNSPTNTFIREGSGDRRASKAEVDAFYRDQTFGTKTLEVVPGTSRADIHQPTLAAYRDYMSRFNPNASYNRMSEEDFLHKLVIMDGDKLTYGGLLFLGQRHVIDKHIGDFRIDLLEIPGISYSDAKTRYEYRLPELENLWEYYFGCMDRLRLKVKVSYDINAQGFGQEKSPGFDALREALVNMLMHTDYFGPMKPRIRIFTDRIEFFNPGGLPKPFAEIRSKDISLPRNKGIAKLFRMATLAENAGYGFDKIDDYWLEYNGTQPQYDVAIDSVMVTVNYQPEQVDAKIGDTIEYKNSDFEIKDLKALIEGNVKNLSQVFDKEFYRVFTGYLRAKYFLSDEEHRRNFGESIQELRRKLEVTSEKRTKIFGERLLILYILILTSEDITAKEASKVLEISDRSVEKYFAQLKKQNKIERIGPDKGGHWQVILNREEQ